MTGGTPTISSYQMLISPNSSSNTYKVILAGPHNAGKTMFLWQWQERPGKFESNPTIGADFVCKEFVKNGKKYKIHMWDTAGQEAYHSITAPYFRSCVAVLLLFDLSDRKSFDNLDYWLNLINENTNTTPIIFLVANKCDLSTNVVSDEDLKKYATANDLRLYKVSAKENINIDKISNDLIDLIIELSQTNQPSVETMLTPKNKQSETGFCC